MGSAKNAEEQESVRRLVRQAYGNIATAGGSCCSTKASCCGVAPAGTLAKGLGYDDADLAKLPDGADMGLSCGNPTALASLKSGEVVLDLGSGGGFDVFIAGEKVGTAGHALAWT